MSGFLLIKEYNIFITLIFKYNLSKTISKHSFKNKKKPETMSRAFPSLRKTILIIF
jgi:hypothetical protein